MQLRFLTLATAAASVAACVDSTNPVSPNAALRVANGPSVANSIWADSVVRNTGPGSVYGLFMPADWNGDVIYYAHGTRDVLEPVNLPSAIDSTIFVRNALGTLGFAIAYSSWSSNGFAIEDAIRRTHQLQGLFVSRYGRPQNSYLMGHSLGAQAALALAEQFPGQYDGAYLLCGTIAGTEFTFQNIGNVRVLFDYFYPGVLPGTATTMPLSVLSDPFGLVAGPAVAAIQGNPVGALTMFQIDQVYIEGNSIAEKIQTLVRILVGHSRFVNDVLSRVHGHFPFDNDETIYTIGGNAAPLAALNATIARFNIHPDADAWREHNYEPTGEIAFPVFTLHTNRDYLAPFRSESLFAAKVAQAGASNLLVQRTINRWGHCTFTVQEMLTGFQDLVNWVENGVKPAP
jgi:pimeloyl-ACP methyl ester carboxylesterase